MNKENTCPQSGEDIIFLFVDEQRKPVPAKRQGYYFLFVDEQIKHVN
jgi:hypothetical protein